MYDTNPAPPIAVMGAGAMGCLFGGLLARAGAPTTLVARPEHVAAFARDGLVIEGSALAGAVPVRATTEPDGVAGAALVLFAVKTSDTESAAAAIAPHLRADATVLVLQNGVDNVRRIRTHVRQAVVPAVVYAAGTMAGPGRVRHNSAGADLVIGESAQAHARREEPPALSIDAIAALAARAGIGCRVSPDIDGELWAKLLVNCAFNAVSALGRSRYARMIATPEALALMHDAAREVAEVAAAEGIRLPDADVVAIVARVGAAMAAATSSTAQDIARGRLTEIDELNGFIARRGAALGIATPVNRTLHALVKLRERARPDEAG